jgi:glycerophosphoryl diester phosphodiesterase
MEKMKIFAHRGDWGVFPENSEAAIISSINKGFDIELDTRFTADKKIVLMHDANLLSLCGVDKNIADLQYDEIKKLPFVSEKSERPVLFDELAAKFANVERQFAIHFKQSDQNEENCSILANVFKKYQLHRNCFLFNLSLESCEILRKIDPEIKLSILISDVKFEPFVFLFEEVENHHDLYDILWAAEYQKFYDKGLIARAHRFNKKIIAVSPELHKDLGHPKAIEGYTECWQDLSSWGVDGICTDYPQRYLEFMQGDEIKHE